MYDSAGVRSRAIVAIIYLAKLNDKAYDRLAMTPEERKELEELVEKIKKEQNHAKFIELVEELNALLDTRERRFPQPPRK